MALNVTGAARAAAAIVAALAAPAIAEARRRAKDGTREREERDRDRDGGRDRDRQDDDDGDHHGRGIWRRSEAGDGGTARASADGGTITLGSPAYEDGGTAVAQASDADMDTTIDAEAADAGDGVIEAAARNDGFNYGGRIGNMVDDWRRVQEKRFGGIGDNRGDGPAETGTNIQVDPATGAIDYDNGNVAFIRDDDGSFFVQTGNITFEAGSMGGQGDGGNNDTDFES